MLKITGSRERAKTLVTFVSIIRRAKHCCWSAATPRTPKTSCRFPSRKGIYGSNLDFQELFRHHAYQEIRNDMPGLAMLSAVTPCRYRALHLIVAVFAAAFSFS